MNTTSTLILSTCESCIHYRPVGADPTLCCVAHPPAVQMMVVQAPPGTPGGVSMNKVTMFPSPHADWTCAEHRSRRSH